MCTAACRDARVDLVIWGTPDPVMGACGTVIDLAEDPRLGPLLAARGGLMAGEAAALLTAFFKQRRQRG
jgi:tRNA(adenine34) deaminase